jgi:hypothetical protein
LQKTSHHHVRRFVIHSGYGSHPKQKLFKVPPSCLQIFAREK